MWVRLGKSDWENQIGKSILGSHSREVILGTSDQRSQIGEVHLMTYACHVGPLLLQSVVNIYIWESSEQHWYALLFGAATWGHRSCLVLLPGGHRSCLVLLPGGHGSCLVLLPEGHGSCLILLSRSHGSCLVLPPGSHRSRLVLLPRNHRICLALKPGGHGSYLVLPPGDHRSYIVLTIGIHYPPSQHLKVSSCGQPLQISVSHPHTAGQFELPIWVNFS